MATDTIAAISTPLGRGAIGIVRASGPRVREIVQTIAGTLPPPRQAAFTSFRSHDDQVLDEGIVVYFPAPGSVTGEDVCEFHAHGSLVVLQQLFESICAVGARPARPGEFTERAFRNGKIDLAQAEAVADLIDSRSARAARSALRTLQGEFSDRIANLIANLHDARAELEGAIDFPDDIATDHLAARQLDHVAGLHGALQQLIAGARQGARLNEGVSVAIIGAPNVGKSTLLNRLARLDKAIVSASPGTTRDVIETEVVLDGLPLRLYDTAGLRSSADAVEIEGMRRAAGAMASADIVLLVTDRPGPCTTDRILIELGQAPLVGKPIITVHNKIDLHGVDPAVMELDAQWHVFVAARDAVGMDLLTRALAGLLAVEDADENEFVARGRHLAALQAAAAELVAIDRPLLLASPELAAEALRRAAQALGEITGASSSEDLLREIFSRFCLGK